VKTVPKQLTPWVPGESGNPGGRPKGLAVLVRGKVKDGKELVDFYLKVFRDEKEDMKFRLEAAHWLGERGWGKALQFIEINEPKKNNDEIEQKVNARIAEIIKIAHERDTRAA